MAKLVSSIKLPPISMGVKILFFEIFFDIDNVISQIDFKVRIFDKKKYK